MPTLREVRNRISGVKKTQKITRAMKMVSAAKLRRAQTSVTAARPYAAAMQKLLEHLALEAGAAAAATWWTRRWRPLTRSAIRPSSPLSR